MVRRTFDDIVLFARTGLNPRHNFKLGRGENKYITIKNIHNNALAIDENTDVVDDDALTLIHKRSQIKKGDVLFCSIGHLGDMYIITDDPKDWDINESVFAFTLNTEIIRQKYFYYLFKNHTTIEYLTKNSSGSTFKSIKMNQLKQMMFDVPSLAEQDLVAAVLDGVSKIISLRQQQLTELENLIKARFAEMFGDSSWKMVTADTIMHNMRNGLSPSNRGTHSAKVLTLSAITQGIFNANSWKNGLFDIEPPKEKRITSQDFYMCRGNGNKDLVGIGVYSSKDYCDLVFPDTVIAASVDQQQICLPYLYHAWKSPFIRKQIECGARTTNGTYKINQGIISNIEIALPPLPLQTQFAAFVEATDKSRVAIQRDLCRQLLYSINYFQSASNKLTYDGGAFYDS